MQQSLFILKTKEKHNKFQNLIEVCKKPFFAYIPQYVGSNPFDIIDSIVLYSVNLYLRIYSMAYKNTILNAIKLHI